MDSTLMRTAVAVPRTLATRVVGVDVTVAQEMYALTPSIAWGTASTGGATAGTCTAAAVALLGAVAVAQPALAHRPSDLFARNDIQGPPARGTPV